MTLHRFGSPSPQSPKNELGEHELPPLPYKLDALQPHISKETLEYHYGKHHAAYVKRLNSLIRGTELQGKPLEWIVANVPQGPIYNNAAQAWNHDFYWHCLTPEGGGQPQGTLAEAINASFRSFSDFKEEFTNKALTLFGSGWVWLTKKASGALSLEAMVNAGTPLALGQPALLTCDVWEHAYYIDYRNQRAQYLQAFWNLVNWQYVSEQLARQ
jgi:Fe-Mn family superoxide dismutase